MYWYCVQVLWFVVGAAVGFTLCAILASGRESQEIAGLQSHNAYLERIISDLRNSLKNLVERSKI